MYKKQIVDLCYVIDCTGSMSSYINKTKDIIKEILVKVKKKYANIAFRTACVGYRDWSDKDKRLESQDFTDVDTCKKFISNLKATGGGDQCEDVFGGLMKATELYWKSTTRLVFCVCDAPQHGKQYYDKAGDKWPNGHPSDPKQDYHKIVIRTYKNKNIKLFFSKCNNTVDKMIEVLKNEAIKQDLCLEKRDLTKIDDFLSIAVEAIKSAIEQDLRKRKSIKVFKKRDDDESEVPVMNKSKKLLNKFSWFVGIDIGTDGTCWCFSNDGSKYYMQDKGIHGRKDKTNILLDKSLKVVAFGRRAQEMYLKNPKYKDYYYFEQFKMALYDQEMLKYDKFDYNIDIKKESNHINEDIKLDDYDYCDYRGTDRSYLKAANGKLVEASIVFTQAFIYLKDEIMDYMEDKDIIVNLRNIQWLLTVPAIWSQGAKKLMQKAANDSGMVLRTIPNHMEIALEPECASITLREKAGLKKGSKYILLDLGGGTADICCHQVCKNNNVKQIRYPSGGKWGSIYIDEEFINLISELFKLDSKNIINEFMIENPIKLLQFKELFREVKHSFKGNEKKHLKIRMPEALQTFILEKHSLITKKDEYDNDDDDDSYDDDSDSSDDEYDASTKLNDLIQQKIKNGLSKKYSKIKRGDIEYKNDCLYIHPFIMEILFNTVLEPLIKHVDNNVLTHKNVKDCKTIFLTGELSSSNYVRDFIIKQYKPKKINIYLIDRPSTAVAEGAVKFGLNPSIIEYYSEYSYGIRICRDFDNRTDEDKRKIWTDDGYVVFNAFERLIKCGPININDSDPIEYFAPLNADDGMVEITVYRTKKEDLLFTHDAKGYLLPDVEQLNEPRMFHLPNNWDETMSFPIRFDFKNDIRVEVGLNNYPDNQRFIALNCQLSVDN